MKRPMTFVASKPPSMIQIAFIMATLSAGALFTASAQQDQFPGKRVVNVIDEPRHRPVHRDGNIILLEVLIQAGDMSLPHTHDAAILYTVFSDGEEEQHGRTYSVTNYAQESLTHEVFNEGPNMFRRLALANLGPGVENSQADMPTGLEVDPQLENNWFRSYRLTLAPGEATSIQQHANPSVVVQATQGTVHVTREDGIVAELVEVGDWAWRTAGSHYLIRNVGRTTVDLVVNEGRI